MEKAGYQMKPAFARAKALVLVFQSHIQAAIDWLFSWVDSFQQQATSMDSFQYEREFKQLYSVYVAVFEQLFRRGYAFTLPPFAPTTPGDPFSSSSRLF
jgi:cyclopropane fatty-acyl-phospholipid synthase-like methyltransferase